MFIHQKNFSKKEKSSNPKNVEKSCFWTKFEIFTVYDLLGREKPLFRDEM